MRNTFLALALAPLAGLLVLVSPLPGVAQPAPAAVLDARPELRQLRDRAERRFEIMQVRRGLILVPKADVPRVRTIEIADGTVLIDGVPVTGRELRERLGDAADTVVQLSFLDADARTALFGHAAESGAPVTPAAPERPSSQGAADDTGWNETARYRHGGARVRFGGDVTIPADEAVNNDVVVILGSAHIEGRVDGEVVAVGGSVYLGPKAEVKGSVTSVGGGIERAAGSRVGGEITEVRVSAPTFGPVVRVRPWRDWTWFANPFGATADLVGTLVRMGLIGLFAALLVAMVPGPVRRVADRVTTEPWRAGLVGLAAQILFVPLLVLTVVILAVSIIGIPLLLLVPFALVAVLIAFLLGFAGTGCALGQLIARRASGNAQGLLASLVVGLAIIWALPAIARFAGLAGLPAQLALSVVLLVGFLIEYLAWTVGLGAVILSRYGRRHRPQAGGFVPPPPAPDMPPGDVMPSVTL